MGTKSSAGELEQVSDLIGQIYDCALEPALWSVVLGRIRDHFCSINATLYVFDVERAANRLQVTAGVPPEWESRMLDYDAEIAALYDYVGDAMTRPLDRHFILRREVPDDVLFANRYFMEWARPQGIGDLIQATLLREPKRLGLLAMARHERDGRVGEREVRLMNLLAPHLRRAVKISDIIDMKSIAAATFGAAIDEIATPVIVVAPDRTVLYSNPATRALLSASVGLTISDGKFRASDAAATERLARAIHSAAHGASHGSGSGFVVSRQSERLTIAYVLPLVIKPGPRRILANAAAAIFLTSTELTRGSRLSAIAEAFALTPAETRVLDRIATGSTLQEASSLLGIARTTAKTHLARILAKTGTRRQTELLALVNRLTSTPLADRPRSSTDALPPA